MNQSNKNESNKKPIVKYTEKEGSVKSIAEYIEAVKWVRDRMGFETEENKDPGVFPWFRGLASEEYALTPSIHYLTDKKPWLFDEFWYYEYFAIKAVGFKEFNVNLNNLDELAHIVRHYQGPSRLMDWSESALVSLFFSVSEEKDDCENGKVYMLHPFRWNKGVWGTYSVPNSGSKQVLDSYYKLIKNQFMEGKPSLFDSMNANLFGNYFGKYALAVRPPHIHHRLDNQRCMFTIHGTELTHRNAKKDRDLDVEMEKQAVYVFEKLSNMESRFHYPVLGEIIISKCAKEEIRKELETMGITPFTVYRDYMGLDMELRGKFMKKAE